MKRLALLFLGLLLVACDTSALRVPTRPPADVTSAPGNCIWNWNTRPQPEVAAEVQAAVDAAGIPGVTVTATSFGEDCIDPQGHQPVSFAPRETDFDLRIAVASLADRELLGTLLGQVLEVLETFPRDRLPGPQSGRVTVTFATLEAETYLSFMLDQAVQSRRSGLSGAALLDALEARP
jgi:hypothetical protein